MESLLKIRQPIRANITRTINQAQVEMQKAQPDLLLLQGKYRKLEELLAEVTEVDQKVLDTLVEGETEPYTTEYNRIDEYKDSVRDSLIKMDTVLTPKQSSGIVGSVLEEMASANTQQHNTRYKLPKIELIKFNGELKQWLGWWAQFSKIHEDENLHASDKFQYLLQSMEEGTEAKELVSSYPMTSSNYPIVVKALQERFGNEELLMQVYIRELLKLVIHNADKNTKTPLEQLYFKLTSHLRSLGTLNLSKADPSAWLFPLVESSLPEETLRVWQRSSYATKMAPVEDNEAHKSLLDNLMEFIASEVHGEQRIALAREGFHTEETSQTKSSNKKKGLGLQDKAKNKNKTEIDQPTVAGLINVKGSTSTEISCIFCSKTNHQSRDCMKAQTLSLEDKTTKIKAARVCFICFRKGHSAKDCKCFTKCIVCHRKHSHLMCPDVPVNKGQSKGKTDVESENKSTDEKTGETTITQVGFQCQGDVLLKTVFARIKGEKKESVVVRLMFDEGSQRSYGTTKTVEQIGSRITGQEMSRTVLFDGSATAYQKINKREVVISRLDGNKSVKLELREKPLIGGKIPSIGPGPWMQELKSKRIWINDLCQEQGNKSSIDILIGSDYWGDLMTGKMVKLNCGLIAMETIFGWTLSGRIPSQESAASQILSMFVTEEDLAQLWSIEAIGIKDPIETKSRHEQEIAARNHFMETVTRNKEGRYSVKLPWINENKDIPCNKQVAVNRLITTTNKLKENGFYQKYDEVFKSWLEEDLIEKILPDDEEPVGSYYLPHLAVIKPTSTTTPIRPVFDASCKAKGNPSLNDCLHVGPNLIEMLPAVLLRFREKQVGVQADIRKAFQMIGVAEEDRKFLQFLWWEDEHNKEMVTYRHRRVVFGVNSSPFLLAAVLELHLSSVKNENKPMADQLSKGFYVDNCVTSVDTIEDYQKFEEWATNFLMEAKMDLRQWEHSHEMQVENQITTVLGMNWNKFEDTLSCKVKLEELATKKTKRNILATVQRVYDPIGYLSPAILQMKVWLQKTWKNKIGWDQELPDDISREFEKWLQELHYLNEMKMPRQMLLGDGKGHFEIHTFCDASLEGYAAVVFVRSDNLGSIEVRLASAKSRVSPLKKATIPRLELMACLIGSRITAAVKEALSWEEIPTIYWTDSSTALAWIKRADGWGTFVSNRVDEIRKFSDADSWNHIPGVNNPADLASRGCTPKQLICLKWWEGPEWLKMEKHQWPNNPGTSNENEINEERKKTHVTNTVLEQPEPRFSSFLKNLRTAAWIRRFIRNCKLKGAGKYKLPQLSKQELRDAEKDIIRQIQNAHFVKPLDIKGMIVKLNSDGLWCVQTKLLYKEDTEQFRTPVILPWEDPIVVQLIQHVHRVNCHAGTQYTLGKLREKYWILRGRKTVNQVIHKCQVCKRYSSQNAESEPAPLPKQRIETVAAYQTTGVDLAGPLYLKGGTKVWVVLYTCAVYRGVHLDLVESLSSEAFLHSLERFLCTMGRPNHIYSDNGTNFVGAENMLKKLNWNQVKQLSEVKQIKWIFNPPTASWWGGWWERLIQTMKDLLKKMLGKAKVTYDELRTCLAAVECTINDRPLTTLNEDSNDLIPLTPAMFTRSIPVAGFPEGTDIKGRELSANYTKIQKIKESLQARFRKEYLGLLIQKKGPGKIHCLQIGNIVLVGSDNRKRFEWPLGRVVELIQGRDGIVRVCKVKTTHGVLTRPVQRLSLWRLRLQLISRYHGRKGKNSVKK